MNIAIIGSCGYIGTLFYNKLHNKEGVVLTCYDIQEVDVYPNHIKKRASEISAEEISTFDVIIYLAGISRKTDCEKEDYSIVYDANVTELEEFVKKTTPKQLCIYASTGSLYSGRVGPSSENDVIIPSALERYESSMYQRELVINALQKRTIGLRFGTVIGVCKNIRPEIIYNGLYYSAFSFQSMKVWNPNAWRSILFFEDLYRVFERFAENRDKFRTPEIFNVGSFNATIGNIATSISDRTGAQLQVHDTLANRHVGFQMDTSKICERLNYTFVGTNDTIHEYYDRNRNDLLNFINNPVNRTYKCILCNSMLLTHVVDLGNQPLANNCLTSKTNAELYPLHLFRCRNCFHSQINYLVDRTMLFKNYIYESGTSATLRNYFRDLAIRYNTIGTDSKNVLEIACNDGFQLDEFKRLGWNTYGVDPAENLAEIARGKGHTIDCKYWGKDAIGFAGNVSFDLIVAENVLAHVTNPVHFLQCCERVMTENTLLVIQTSQANMYRNNEFDTIYHEHISFFTIKSMCYAVKQVGCTVINVYKPDIHGVSYVFEIKKGIRDVLLPLLQEEESIGLYSPVLYTHYEKTIQTTKLKCIQLLQEYKNKNCRILGFGAAAKGNVFLNYIFDSRPNVLCPEYIIDDSPAKQNTFTAGTLIPITSSDILNEYTHEKVVIVILAWNFATEIVSRIRNRIHDENKWECICFFPTLQITSV